MYLDLTGTAGLFDPPSDCSSRILREILEQTGMRPAAAVAENKLVCKMANRAVRPAGLIQIQAGTEAAYLAHQDIGLLPGMGSAKPVADGGGNEVPGNRGADAVKQWGSPLFGKRGPLLRDTAHSNSKFKDNLS
jgi:DNA polymerase-4